jgi:arabinogalactan endo-1,4-beta-galactosidase
MRSHATAALIIAVYLALALPRAARADGPIGVDCNYAMQMQSRGRIWRDSTGAETDPLKLFAAAGCQLARIRLWVGDDGPNHLAYAVETARHAKAAGPKPMLVLFLNDDWADFVKQPAPAVWNDLPAEQKLSAIESYAERVTRRFADSGVDIDTFEIGNEIDFGICGVFEEDWPHRVSIDYMRASIWPRMTPILKAAQAGVLKAQPKARFILHLSQWDNVAYCTAFWQAMIADGVRVDVPGLSYFPTSSADAKQRSFPFLQSQVATIATALGKPVLICETGYPARADFTGQFAGWNHPADGYPLTDAGQALWLHDFVAIVRSDPHFVGAIYWSPEWYGGGLWDAFALFDDEGKARPGVRALASDSPAATPTSNPTAGH